MYAQVVVLTYQAPDINSFTYKVPKELEKQIMIGQLVEVPFGKRNPMGIVVSVNKKILNQVQDDKKITVKPLSRILLDIPILQPYQIELLQWMREYYLAPMVNCMEAALPPIPKRVAQLEGYPTARRSETEFFPSYEPKNRPLTGGKVVTGPVQSLILVPTINRIPETLAKFPKAKNPVVYHNELKTKERFEAWQRIISGNCDYIFGSRSAIFAPARNLKEIIIYDEHDSAYKDIRSPYFDTLTIAEKLSDITKTQIKIVDPSPKVTTYFNFKNHIKMQKFNVKCELVSLEKERLAGNFSPISARLAALMANSQNTLLFLNKKKESGHIYCKNCHEKQFIDNRPEVCPNCKSPDIYFNVLNLESLAVEIKRISPKSHINLLDEKSAIQPQHKDQKLTIDVATATIFYKPLLKKYDLVCFVRPDSLLNEPDFSTGEAVYSQVINLMKLVTNSGKLIIQTYDVNNKTLNYVAKQSYTSFLENQIEERKPLNYPPYSVLVKLKVSGKDELKIKSEAQKLVNHLNYQKQSNINSELLTILGPYKPIFWQKQNTSNIIIKYKTGDYSLKLKEKAIYQVGKLLPKSKKGFQIIIEPASIN